MVPVLQPAAPATSSESFYEPTERLGFYKLSHKHLAASHWGHACKAECVCDQYLQLRAWKMEILTFKFSLVIILFLTEMYCKTVPNNQPTE